MKEVVEAGCARSGVLPLLATRLGLKVSGVDYSPAGCEQARRLLQSASVDGEIHCCDIFALPPALHQRFDGVISLGLIEHFTNTSSVLQALAALLRPGGIMISIVPNMCGSIGWIQRLVDRSVFDIHVALDRESLCGAHIEAGLVVTSSDYLLSTSFGVVNAGSGVGLGLPWRCGGSKSVPLRCLHPGRLRLM
jgi:SAM-dependent methyltransferase